MAIYIAKENKCATVVSDQQDLSGYAETNQYCRIGGSVQARTYLGFDLSGIPANAEIISATLYFYSINGISREPSYVSYYKTSELHQVLQAWDEDIVWTTKPNSTNFLNFGDTAAGWIYKDITQTVQGWINGINNNGLCMYAGGYTSNYDIYFDIYNHYTNNGNEAYIEIEYKGQQMYKIAEPRIREIGDQVRRLSGTTDYMTVEEMVTKLTEYQFGDGLPVAEEGVF